ncbi:MAG TPA: patatin-like phospholipase family protein [Acetobacteraceae bacterium]|nr:patatin-like phospholipase family protein [Acetobacteraceae bacterium]
MSEKAAPTAKPVALVLQGGGALGAYEWGAVTRLVEEGFQPVAVTGVSIGAINAAAIAGARGGDIAASLKRLWQAITLPALPFAPAFVQETLSALGNPNFYKLRTDLWALPSWTALCDIGPMQKTLSEICDFPQISNPGHMRFAVTATDVGTGSSVRFLNTREAITPDHVLASGALPPGFPMAIIEKRHYWDGGLFDNTPLNPLLELLTDDEVESLPIIVINLFPSGQAEPIPTTLLEVRGRSLELSFENRFWENYGRHGDFRAYAAMLEALNAAVPPASPLRNDPEFLALLRRRALRNLHIISSDHAPMTGGMDFSAAGVVHRYERGREGMDRYLKAGHLARAKTERRRPRDIASPPDA